MKYRIRHCYSGIETYVIEFDGMQWQMFQHPWYVSNGDHVSKEAIVRDINKMAEQRA